VDVLKSIPSEYNAYPYQGTTGSLRVVVMPPEIHYLLYQEGDGVIIVRAIGRGGVTVTIE
jgi:hypothetical protein